jgi:hypothetical protein
VIAGDKGRECPKSLAARKNPAKKYMHITPLTSSRHQPKSPLPKLIMLSLQAQQLLQTISRITYFHISFLFSLEGYDQILLVTLTRSIVDIEGAPIFNAE